eukprot:scaffold10966_cov38-Prasinocladus_malaysianus.AAC.1
MVPQGFDGHVMQKALISALTTSPQVVKCLVKVNDMARGRWKVEAQVPPPALWRLRPHVLTIARISSPCPTNLTAEENVSRRVETKQLKLPDHQYLEISNISSNIKSNVHTQPHQQPCLAVLANCPSCSKSLMLVECCAKACHAFASITYVGQGARPASCCLAACRACRQ